MKVKPAPGLVVRDPMSKQALPAEGGEVGDTNFWRRRLACGDVVAIKEAPAPVAKQEPTK